MIVADPIVRDEKGRRADERLFAVELDDAEAFDRGDPFDLVSF